MIRPWMHRIPRHRDPTHPWWEADAAEYARWSGPTYDRIVDDRTFLLGLDALYRDAMKEHERNELLGCAQDVAATLKVEPANVPIEGYYAEDPDLTTYFRLLRALQRQPAMRKAEVESLSQFRRLRDVTSSPIFGRPVLKALEQEDKLLPAGRDPVSAVLSAASTQQECTVARVMAAAPAYAEQSDDYSLVGLACRARDAVVIAAVRESVVLYAERVLATASLAPPQPRPKYIWQVDPALAAAAQRFIDGFNQLFGLELPPATATYAHIFGLRHPNIVGRCVCVAQTGDVPPAFYHWAIVQDGGQYAVHEFWSPEIWTTERYRSANRTRRPN